MSDTDQYRIPQYLNKPYTFGGFPLDEVIPMGVLGFLGFLLVTNKLIAIALPALWLISIRKLKKNQGSAYLRVLLYWQLSIVAKVFFPKTPLSTDSFWIR